MSEIREKLTAALLVGEPTTTTLNVVHELVRGVGGEGGKMNDWRVENGDLIPGLSISNFQSPIYNP